MLDDTSAAEVRAAVQRAADERGLTLVVAEHQLAGWAGVCDRMVVLSETGRVLADGPIGAVLESAAEALLAAGVWVPGAPAPEPLPIDWAPEGSAEGRTVARVAVDGLSVPNPDGSSDLVHDLDLQLTGGQAAAVLGPSGAGKSTLLRTLAGLQEPSAGTIARTGTTAWLPQQAELVITRRRVIDEVLATARTDRNLSPERRDLLTRRAERVLATLRLDHLREADPWTLSGGEQRRLALAAVVTHQPDVVLLDEPTVGQDRHTWAAVAGVVETLRGEGSIVVASTHDPEFTAHLGATVRLVPQVQQETGQPDHRVREFIEPGTSPAGRCNPLAALVIALGGAVGSFFVDHWTTGLVLLAVIIGLSPFGVRRPRSALVRLVPVGLAALTVGWSTWLLSPAGFLAASALPVAATEALRILCLVLPGALLVAELSPSRLADALAQRLRLPARPVVAAASALLRLQHLFDTWRQLAEVRLLRGLHPGRSLPGRIRHAGSMTFALLISTFRSSAQMALSMDARGFATARVRTFALPSPWRLRDWICCVVALVLVAVPALVS
ncbi:MAG: ATP-binding cassette domain-containing protein [Propionibacteriaceae bacterium]